MPYDNTVPNQANLVRTISGDLAKMRGNFVLLAPAASAFDLSHNLIVSGTLTVSGTHTGFGAAVFDSSVTVSGDLAVSGEQISFPTSGAIRVAGANQVYYATSGVGFGVPVPTEDMDVAGDIRVRGGTIVDLLENVDLFHASLVSGDSRVIRQSAHYPVSITDMVVEAVGGSAVEVDVRIDGTPITGLDNVLVDTTERTHTGSAANTLGVGGKLDLFVVSGGAAATDVAISFKATRLT